MDRHHKPSTWIIQIKADYTILEIEGFRFGERPILIKEMAWFNIGTRSGDSVIFKFTDNQTKNLDLHDWKQMRYYEKNIHGIPFFFGDTPFETLPLIIRVIKTHCRCLVTKGREKTALLRDLFELPVIDLGETLGTPSYRKLLAKFPVPDSFYCKYHGRGKSFPPVHCSQVKSNLLLSYCLQRNVIKSSHDDSVGFDTVR